MFMDEDFLLSTEWARRLYHGHAEGKPIVDYHCHLDPRQVFEDARFEDLSQVWLFDHGAGDHYKWRLMRANGVPERLITGDGDSYEKFLAYVRTMERALGNPLYEWSHLELRRAFGIDLTICEKNAPQIWRRANERIAQPDFSARGLIRSFGVRCICTTDDPVSDLSWHQKLAAEKGPGFKMLPTFRPDALMAVEAPGFSAYAQRLSQASGIEVSDWASLKAAAAQRVQAFHKVGGRLADHGLNSFRFVPFTDGRVAAIAARALSGEPISSEEADAYRSALSLFLMGEYEKRDWTLQLHMNVIRNANTHGFRSLGADAGFDSVGDQPGLVTEVACLLDAANVEGALPRTILYSLDESQWMALATLMQSFQGGVRQRLQLGCAWWFSDSLAGIERQLTVFAQESLLANFTGMLTDSRSFLSYPRHEYFRRVLCRTLGQWVEDGRIPADEEWLGGIVEGICYRNARDYFGFFEQA
ncbi:D-glucuronate isomerase [Olsenella sp. KH3B4]|uniref:glucuronate isomerase n=1 Tax=Olsenella sp. KH3B4 TaxID=1855394 RepID=UPI0008CFFD09|nr:glucuronate isomerase [Olsenella sp. KH3B4]SES66350.1 D-glucuronate isomerase [Olsenella sp. KH3B4]